MDKKPPAFSFRHVRFHFDEHGKHLEEPREITADDAEALYFELSNEDLAHHRGVGIRAVYDWDKIEGHRWNEDGRPPSFMVGILNANVHFLGHFIEIDGLEYPNMFCSGLVFPRYFDENNVPNRKEIKAFRALYEWKNPVKFEGYYYQKIVLY